MASADNTVDFSGEIRPTDRDVNGGGVPPPIVIPPPQAAGFDPADFLNVLQGAFSQLAVGHTGRIKNIPLFSGSIEESWSSFLREYELVAESEGWSDDRKARQLFYYLKGSAKDFWAGMDDKYNWPYVTRLMSAHFIPPEVSMFHADKLVARNQGDKEGLAEYAAEVSRLLNAAFPSAEPAMREALLRLFFIRGLRPDYYFHVMSAVPGARDSYRSAYSTALNYESGKRLLQHNARLAHSAQAMSADKPQVFAGFALPQGRAHQNQGAPSKGRGRDKGRKGTSRSTPNRPSRSRHRSHQRDSRPRSPKRSSTPTSTSHKREDKSKPTCNYCGKFGHVEEQCYKKQNDVTEKNKKGQYNQRKGDRKGKGKSRHVNAVVAKSNSKGDSSSANRDDPISDGDSDSEQEESRHSVFNAPRHLFAVNLITLCCVVSSLVSPALAVVPPSLSQAEVSVCPEQVGGIVRALPHIPKLLTDPPQVSQITCVKKRSATRYLKDNVFNGVQGHLCSCIRSSFNFLFDLTGLTRFIRKSAKPVPLNHTQCLNMVHNHTSLAGELKYNDETKEWETQNSIPNYPSYLPINCCFTKIK